MRGCITLNVISTWKSWARSFSCQRTLKSPRDWRRSKLQQLPVNGLAVFEHGNILGNLPGPCLRSFHSADAVEDRVSVRAFEGRGEFRGLRILFERILK